MPLSSVLGAQSLVRPGVCTSTTRPASPFEGQLIYESDTDKVLAYNGSVWEEYRKAGAGQVLQVVSATKTDTYTHSSGVTFTNVTGLAATITPSSTSSKILITFNIYTSGNNGGTYFKVTGGNAASWVGDAASNRTRISFGSVNAAGTNGATTTGSYLDSPASTSAITYQVQMAAADNTTTTFINRTATDTDNTANNRSTSTITLMEIAG